MKEIKNINTKLFRTPPPPPPRELIYTPNVTTRSFLPLLALLCALSTYGQTDPFVTTWETTMAMESITIPTTGSGYNYSVTWEDGGTPETGVMGSVSHTYATPGTHTVSITGEFPRIYFNDVSGTNPNSPKIRTIAAWGGIAWTSMASAFAGCSRLEYTATDVPNLSGVTDMTAMFFQAVAFNGNLSNWDVSNVNNMLFMFNTATAFNGDISNWDVSSVTDMSYMFNTATAFNGDIGNWNVSMVENMSFMFAAATAFNGDLSNWDVSAVTNFTFFLLGAELSPENYDKLLNGWNALTLQNGLTFDAGISQYTSAGAAARQAIMDDDMWTINDGGEVGVVVSFAENGTGTVTDINMMNDTGISYALVAPATGSRRDDDNALFNIDMNTGVLTFKDSPDFESPADAGMNNIYAVEVTVTEGGTVTKVTVSVSVTNVNDISPVVVDPGILDRSLDTGFDTHVIELADTFTDEDMDMLMLSVVSANVAVVTAAIATTTLTLTEVGPGESVITVTANDGSNTVSDEFTVKVNKPPTATGISDLSLMEGFGTEDIDLSATFTDPDTDVLTFSVMSADEGVVTATIADGTSKLTLTGTGSGSSVITVTATDGRGGMDTDMFTVTVEMVIVEMVTGVAEARSLSA